MEAKDALALFVKTKSAWSESYTKMKDDVRFSIGLDHHHGKTEKDCQEQGLLTIPVIPQFIHQVVNDMRMNTPSIDVLPDSEGAPKETAKVFKGLIRNIEYKSKADEVYDTAGEYAVRGGLGFARVDHDYIAEDSFLQELKLKRVQNPESVYLDPSYTECDGSDAEYGFILDKITKDKFEELYPGKQFISFEEVPPRGDIEEITIAEFFKKKYTEVTKEMGPDGTPQDAVEGSLARKRKLRKITIERFKYSGADTLEDTTFPGKYIPIVPFHGEEVWVDGKRTLGSLHRQAKDAARRVSKWASKESELLDMSPIAPILAPYGAVEDFGDEYSKIGDVNVIRYKQFDASGNRLDKPERLSPPPIPAGFVNAMQEATEHVKQAMGMYNASIGQRSNETSGVAIDARKVEGEVATFHFADNRNRSIQHIGRILVCAIPEIYDTERVIQIIGDEEEPKMVAINGAQPVEGQKEEYDLTKGQYDVRVTTGASFTTKRQEAAALLGDVIKKTPQLMGVMGDLWAKNLDVPGADALAARLRKTIPKELIADEDAELNGVQAPDPEKEEMAKIIEALTGQLDQAEQALQSKEAEEALKAGELKLKHDELKLKEGELKVKMADTIIGGKEKLSKPDTQPAAPTAAPVPSLDDSVEVLELRIQEKLAQMSQAEQDAAQQAQREAEQQQIELEREAMENELKLTQIEIQKQTGQAVVESLQSIRSTLNDLANRQLPPITIITDENGTPIRAV
jgi:hypothetical protein